MPQHRLDGLTAFSVRMKLTRRPTFLRLYRRLALLLQLGNQFTKPLHVFAQHHLQDGKPCEKAMFLNPAPKAIYGILNLEEELRIAASSRIGSANEPADRFL
jgi:hypothetical protein